VSPVCVSALSAAHTRPAVPASTDAAADDDGAGDGAAGVEAVVLALRPPHAASASTAPMAAAMRQG